MNKLNISKILLKTTIEGPGIRMAIWLQGCTINCKGCSNKEMIPIEEKMVVSVEVLYKLIIKCKEKYSIEGITLLGGEPFIQPDGLFELIKLCKTNNISVICFTGFIYERLISEYNELLSMIDILIDGPFMINKLDFKRRLIGSQNQRVLKLTDRYKNNDYFDKPHSEFEIQMFNDRIHINGDGVIFDKDGSFRFEI